MAETGRVIVLNGASRAGKTTIARAVQATLPGLWMNLGMDHHIAATPPALSPGVGLRPGAAQCPAEVEEAVPVLYAALYDSVAAHARHGLNVVMDVKHHDRFTIPRPILPDCARRLDGIRVLFVGVRCAIDAIWSRRQATWGHDRETAGADVVAAVELSQTACHDHGVDYDLELDTSLASTAECVASIRAALADPPSPSAFEQLAARAEPFTPRDPG